MVEKKTRICVRLIMAVLCVLFFNMASYAQTSPKCSGGIHEYVSEVLVPASEDKDGQVQNTCIFCGDTYVERLPVIGHAYGLWEDTENQNGDSRMKRRICSRCGRSEEGWFPIAGDSAEGLGDRAGFAWKVNEMDYVLTAATGGVWGYAAIMLWWNSLVLIWYKKECLRNKEKKHDME